MNSTIAPPTLSSLPVAMPSTIVKITMAVPSLNSDSPAMTISRFFGAPADLRIPMTAIGSVGEIRAPKIRQ